jgi:hypothetical protein
MRRRPGCRSPTAATGRVREQVVAERPGVVVVRSGRDLAATTGEPAGGKPMKARLTPKRVAHLGVAIDLAALGRDPDPAPNIRQHVLELLLGAAPIPTAGRAAQRDVAALAVGRETQRKRERRTPAPLDHLPTRPPRHPHLPRVNRRQESAPRGRRPGRVQLASSPRRRLSLRRPAGGVAARPADSSDPRR